jgi:hypothetical protein
MTEKSLDDYLGQELKDAIDRESTATPAKKRSPKLRGKKRRK